jgi:hypothetical protein
MTSRVANPSTTTTMIVVALLASCRDDSPGGAASTGESSSTAEPVTLSASAADPSGDDEPDASEDAPDPDSTSGSGAAPCADTCVAKPDGWNGPVAVLRTDETEESPACPDAYPRHALSDRFSELEAPSAACGCMCEPADVTCPEHLMLSFHGDDAACGSPGVTYPVSTSCNSGPLGQVGHWLAPFVQIEGGSCTPMPTVGVPPPRFYTRWTMCGGEPLAGTCAGDELCLPSPAPFEERLCVWSDGEHECPSEEFSVRELVWDGVDDQRGCDECTCGTMTGTCGGGIRLWGLNVCPEGGIQDILTTSAGDCESYDPQSAKLLDELEPRDDLACPPSAPSPIGEAVPTGTITVCCSAE